MGLLLIPAPVCLYSCGWHFPRPCLSGHPGRVGTCNLFTADNFPHPRVPFQCTHDPFSSTQSPRYPQGVHFSPQACTYPSIYAAKLTFNQENNCARKQHFFFFCPFSQVVFHPDCFMGQAGHTCKVPAEGMCQEHVAERGQGGTALFGNIPCLVV